MTDHNEALRLADALVKAYPHIYTGLAPSAAALLRQQAERIAELESRVHTCGPTCSKAGCINRRITAERDTLRAEVERLRNAMTAPTIEPNSQNWQGMDGAIAFHLIERHADSWADAGRMMSEWREANDTARKATQ